MGRDPHISYSSSFALLQWNLFSQDLFDRIQPLERRPVEAQSAMHKSQFVHKRYWLIFRFGRPFKTQKKNSSKTRPCVIASRLENSRQALKAARSIGEMLEVQQNNT